MKADWLTVAVRTGGEGMGGVSLLLVDANSEGIRRTRMKMQGWWISTTTYEHTTRRCTAAAMAPPRQFRLAQ